MPRVGFSAELLNWPGRGPPAGSMRNLTTVLPLFAILLAGCAESTLIVRGTNMPEALWAAEQTARLHGALFCGQVLTREQRAVQVDTRSGGTAVELQHRCIK